jgi:putative addiction module component (TIGR02574 family)
MKESLISEIEEMTIEERINFVSDVWDSIAEIPENVQIPEWHKRELEKRLTENQIKVTPWTEVKKRIIS